MPTVQDLIEVRSVTADAAIKWLRGLADALDQADWNFEKKRILASETAVDAFVYTKQRKNDDRNGSERKAERTLSEQSAVDEWVAHLYEQPTDWEEREKRRWRQVIQHPKLRLGVRGAPGGGRTFLTRNSAVAIARESADRIEGREISPYDAPVPFWLTAKALAGTSAADAEETIVDASRRSLAQINRPVSLPPGDWILKVAASAGSLIVIDALDELVASEVEGFRRASGCIEALKGRLIATCRTMQWDERAPWLGWSRIVDVELAPFERREQREFSRRFPPGSTSDGVIPLLAANYPLRQACGSPLLLTFVCILHAEGENLTGANRVTLYMPIIRRLLSGKWRNATPPWAGDEELEEEVLEFLENAAWEIFSEAPEANRFTLAQWKRAGVAPVEKLLTHLARCGVVTLAGFDDRGKRCWSFLHRTLLEFLAARALASLPKVVWLAEAKKHFWYEPEWMEVLTFLGAHVTDAMPLIQALEMEQEDIFQSILYLKVRLATAARQVAPGTLDIIASGLITLFLDVAQGGELLRRFMAMVQMAGGTPLGDRISKILPMRYPDIRVRLHAAEALGRLGDARAFDALVALTEDADAHPGVRRSAAQTLGKLGDPRAVDTLAGLALDQDPSIREAAAEALGLLGDAAAADICARLIEDTHAGVRKSAAEVLGQLGDRRAIEPLARMLVDHDAEVRLRAALSLVELGDTGAVDSVASLLREGDAWIRLNTALWLGQFGDARAIDALAGLLEDADPFPFVRLCAAEALGQLGEACGFDALAGLLDEATVVREMAAEALGRLGDARGIDALVGLLRDRYVSGAPAALGRLGEMRAVDALAGLLLDDDAGIRTSAALALAQLGDARAVNVLTLLLRHQHANVRDSAIKALWNLVAIHRTLRFPQSLTNAYAE